jgi:uncharacterized protein
MTTMNFFDAIRVGNLEEVKAQIAANPTIAQTMDARGFTPLVMATYSAQLPIVKALLMAGADIDEQAASGNTALMGVCFKGSEETVQLLLDHGAAVNIQNQLGATALIFAATYGHTNIAKMLLEAGADKSLKDADGKTAMNHAKHQEMVELLKD